MGGRFGAGEAGEEAGEGREVAKERGRAAER